MASKGMQDTEVLETWSNYNSKKVISITDHALRKLK